MIIELRPGYSGLDRKWIVSNRLEIAAKRINSNPDLEEKFKKYGPFAPMAATLDGDFPDTRDRQNRAVLLKMFLKTILPHLDKDDATSRAIQSAGAHFVASYCRDIPV